MLQLRFNRSDRAAASLALIISAGLPPSIPSSVALPFTLQEALAEPEECRAKVSRVVWEDNVCQPLIELRYREGEHALMDEKDLRYTLEEAHLATIYFQGVIIARMHGDVARAMSEHHFAGNYFEYDWKTGKSEETRREFLYAAFEAANMATGGAQAMHRLLCPDISIASLQRDNGQGFIDLVRQMLQSARSFDKHQDYYPIISEKFDKYFRIERNDERQKLPLDRGTRMFQSITQHHRNCYLATFILFTLRCTGFAGIDVPPGALLKKPRVSLKRQICRGRHIVEFPDEQPSAQAAEEARKRPPPPPYDPRESHGISPEDIRAVYALPYDACNCCERVAEEIAELNENGKKGKLLKCGRCFALDPPHRFSYCSIECQKHDYKFGGHKMVCGKLFGNLGLTPSGWQLPPSYPTPSIALQDQLYKAQQNYTGSFPFGYYHLHYRVPNSSSAQPDTALHCHSLATKTLAEYEEAKDFLLRAISTRDEGTIATWIGGLYLTVERRRPELLDELVRQCAEEWDSTESEVRRWIKRAEAEQLAQQGYAVASGVMARKARLRRTKSFEVDDLAKYFARAVSRELLDRSRCRSAPPYSKAF